MLGAGQQRPGATAKDGLAPDGDGVQRGAVEGVPHGNGLEAARRRARQLERHADGAGASRREEHLVQIAGRQLRQPLRQADSGEDGLAAGTKRQLRHLAGDRFDHSWMAETDLVDVVAVEIHQTPALSRFDEKALALVQHVQTGRGK